jgi:methionyl aminopeptidase
MGEREVACSLRSPLDRFMITRKTPEQIALMRRAGSVVAEMHEVCVRAARPGATTADLDRAAREVLDKRGARSNFLNYHGFPAVACISPNEVIVHGIPGDRVLEDGDIVSIDCGAIIEGWHADAAVTVPVGDVDDESKRLIDVTRRALQASLDATLAGNRLGDVGAVSEAVVDASGFSVVREYVGHGIGTAMHEDPQVPNYGPGGRGLKIKPGLVLAIEPMVNAGTAASRVLADGWTVVTADSRRSAHFEHTVAVTDDGPEVLTLPW